MSKSKFVTIQETGTSKVSLKLTGPIDEETNFTELPHIEAGELVIDLNEVTLINSCGTREWVKWVRTINTDTTVTLDRCPRAFIDQANMFEGLFPKRVDLQIVP